MTKAARWTVYVACVIMLLFFVSCFGTSAISDKEAANMISRIQEL